MFLMELENTEKFSFLRLAHHIARVDGDFRVDEEKMISDYCLEMGIDDVPFVQAEFDLEKALAVFRSKKSQRILLLELLTLAHADDRFDLYEHKLIDRLADTFGIDENAISLYSQWGKALAALKAQGEVFISM